MTAGVSIVICTHNGERLLPRTIEHLNRLEVRHDLPWEVLVVDNDSSDRSAQVAAECWRGTAPFRIVREPRRGLAHARHRGILESKFEYISFVDDDNWVAPDWVEVTHDIFDAMPQVGMCGGDVEAEFEVEPPVWFEKYKDNFAVGVQGERSGDITESRGYLWGAGLNVRKSAIQNFITNGFQLYLTDRTGTKLSSGGDSELCYAACLQGWRLWYDRRLRLRHFIPAQRLQWEYLCKLYGGFGASHVILGIYQKLLSPNPQGRIQEPMWHHLARILRILYRRKRYAFRKRNTEGCRERLEFEFYRVYLLTLMGMLFSYSHTYNRIQMLKKPPGYHETPIYQWGHRLVFDDFVLPYLRFGWSAPRCWTSPDGREQVHYVPTDGKVASLVLPIHRIPAAPTCTLQVTFVNAYVHPPKLKRQRVGLYINDKKIAGWTFTDRGYRTKTVSVPTTILKKSTAVEILFKLPDAESPYRLGDVPDKRYLSVALGAIQLQ
jgi:glycosyltransferase involved in cell wall biosynthesis